MTETWQTAGFGLYVHWPFCLAKCPYCDFNSHVAAAIDQSRWIRAYRAEIARIAALTPGRTLSTIYFGGGTPSLMHPDTVAAVIDAARAAWPLSNDAEITLEANPTSVEAGRFAGYRDAGVNRVSMGAQALNDTDLKALGRLHTAAEARAAFDVARAAFDRVSFDLIYARQHQTVDGWRAELDEAMAMAVDHLSLYQLTIEPGTPFADRHARGGLKGLPDEDPAADMYDLTAKVTAAAGRPAYEISNHAALGAEARHNLIYWRSGDWVAVGPGAHGRITRDGTRHATEAPRAPGAWLQAVETTGQGDAGLEPLGAKAASEEYAMMGLRLSEGISMARWAGFGCEPPADRIAELSDMGLLVLDGDRLTATPDGRRVLNAVLGRLLT